MIQDQDQAQTAKEAAWNKWLNHVMDCRKECRTAGIDCYDATALRREYRRRINRLAETQINTR